uniref:V-type proton ATPase subunit D n=1 Tax=Heterorhabditis bacteriophora TaxID=37862 RepID=A0A1I7WKD7_HETBA
MSAVNAVNQKLAAGQKIVAGQMKKVRNAQAWAGRQLNKAQQIIRELSVSHPDAREVSQHRYKILHINPHSTFILIQHKMFSFEIKQQMFPNWKYYVFIFIILNDKAVLNSLFSFVVVGKSLFFYRNNLYSFTALYVEALYTITHKVGREDCESKENLYKYVLKILIFKIAGFSDPFTMMGVVPGKREKTEIIEAADEDNLKSPKNQLKRDSVLNRFGGSFRRKVAAKKGKFINLFFNNSNIFTDRKQSVLDAVSSLNQITGGLKGIGRFFKEVAQSARANSDDSTDDFLGCITMNLNFRIKWGLL